MTTKTKSPIDHYLETVHNLLPVHRSQEKQYLKKMRIQLEDFTDSTGCTDLDRLYKEFGTPQETVHIYLSSLDTQVIVKVLDNRKRLRLLGITICTLLIILAISTGCINYGMSRSLERESEIFQIINK